MVRAVVVSLGSGFGRVVPSGAKEEIVFDATVVEGDEPAVGDHVLVRVGLGRTGRRSVSLLRPLEPPVVVDPVNPKQALAALQSEGIATKLKPGRIRRIREELGSDDVELESILHVFYLDNEEDAVTDGYLAHDWRFGSETDDVVAELAARIGGPPLLVQTANDGERGLLTMRARDRREIGLDFREGATLASVAEAFDDELARAGDARRWFALDTDDDYLSFFLLEPTVAARLARRRALRFDWRPELPGSVHEAFVAGGFAYRASAFKTAAASWRGLAEEGVLGSADQAWLNALVALAGGLEALTIAQDVARAARLFAEAASLAAGAPAAGLALDVVAVRRSLAALVARGAELPTGSPLPPRFAPELAPLPI